MDDATVVALAFLVVFILMVGTVYLAMLIAPRRPTPQKLMRYEAGNPETGPAKAPLAMQYLGYLLMLVALEPAAALPIAVYIFRVSQRLTSTVDTVTIYTALVGILVLLAASTYAYRYAKKIELWRA